MADIRNTILIIEDSKSFAGFLADILGTEYRVLLAHRVDRGIELARSEQPDLILLDVIMPDMDGYEGCRLLKAAQDTRDIPVIFISALGEAAEQTRGLAIGAIDYLVKPVNAEIVKVKVRNHISLKQQFDALETRALIDPLTGVGNRRQFEETIRNEWRRSLRAGTPLAVMMIDIDYFKYFNDTKGHPEGDVCLRRVAEALRTSLRRAGDTLIRYGGEEFAAILPGLMSDALPGVAEKIRAGVEQLCIPHGASPVSKSVTVSVGAAYGYPSHNAAPEHLVKRADEALYTAKKGGRNRVVILADPRPS